ncbi:MAG: hypothetical protein IH600_07090, partial [Bacteroidetes bacterium]|nr:hypothetical protein [Bacteroidota bacterium]
PEWHPADFNQHYIRGYIPIPVTDEERYNLVGDTIFARTRELGATLISYYIHPDFVTATPNATRQVSEQAQPAAHPQPLDMAVLDLGLDTYLKGERIMFHPEIEPDPSKGLDADFKLTWNYELVNDPDFNEIPYENLNLSVPLTDLDAPYNAIRMAPGKGVIDSVKIHRKEDLSLFRDWWPTDPDASRNLHDMCSGSGLYLLSVTVKADIPSTMTESDNPLMYVKIMTVDSTNQNIPDSITFILRERHFFNASHTLITTPIEVLLGAFELRQTGFTPAVTFAVERPLSGTFPHPWFDTTLTRYERILDVDDRASADSIDNRYHGFDMRIHYGSGINTFLLDAVCLSSPRVFGMLNANDAVFNSSFPHLAQTRSSFIHRIERLLRDDGGTGVLPGMRFLYGPEQGKHSSNWPVSTLAQNLIDSISEGAVSLYCASGYSEPTDVSSAFNRRFVSGFYAYPVKMSFASHGRRPVYPGIDVNEYYDSLNQYAMRGFVEMARIYRKHTEQRQQVSTIHPWIPFVQNHTNLYLGNTGASWNDGDWLREPTAAELRHQCNIALANDADGVMFYALVSSPGQFAVNPWWPETRQQWVDDSSLHVQTGGDIDMNAGTMGYIDRELARRRCDWNGESKWDSTAAYINDFLRPIADIIQEDLTWQNSKIWSIRGYPDAGENAYVNEVLSMRQDATSPIDDKDSTFVIVSEFIHRTTNEPYLFVLNGRTHPEGHRHISVKLKPSEDPDSEWMVENVQSGDIWIVKPSDSPDTTSTANGFTDYFAPGGAALYRLTPVSTPREHLPESLPGNLYVTPGATLALNSANNHLISFGKGIFVEGYLNASGSTFGPSNELWLGIHARNDGNVYLQDCQVIGSSVVAGSGGNVTIIDSRIDDAPYALCNLGGSLYSTRTTAPTCLYGYAWLEGSYSDFCEDNATAAYGAPSWNIGVDLHGSGFALLRKCRLTDFGRGIVARAGTVGTFYGRLGRNTIDAVSGVLVTDSLGWIDFGASTTDDGSQNCFLLQDYTNGFHAWGDGSKGIFAVGSHWEPMPVKLQGTVNADSTLPNCPAPFTGSIDTGSLSKTMTPPTGLSFRNGLTRAICDSNFLLAGQLIGQRMSAANRATLDLATVYTLHRALLQFPQLEELRDTIVLAFLLHPDIRFKLVAADLLADAGRFSDALDIIQAYSFEGAAYLKKEQLIRSALYRPFAYRGGYADGLRALDTLASIAGNDSTWLPFFALYPRLYSGLTLSTPANAVRKAEEQSSFWDRVLPAGIDVWPN